jgi:hypothetical protein
MDLLTSFDQLINSRFQNPGVTLKIYLQKENEYKLHFSVDKRAHYDSYIFFEENKVRFKLNQWRTDTSIPDFYEVNFSRESSEEKQNANKLKKTLDLLLIKKN